MSDASPLSGFVSRGKRPDPDALFRQGLRLSTQGEGGPRDPITAHALFDVAARLGSLEAKVYRRELGAELTAADMDEARKIARDWLTGA